MDILNVSIGSENENNTMRLKKTNKKKKNNEVNTAENKHFQNIFKDLNFLLAS